jgi:predicted O-methyltransferase YrrM
MITNARPMSLDYALNHIAHVFGFLPSEMIGYAPHDPHGGYHSAYDDGFPSGSLWRVEGQALYAMARTLKPQSVLELGTWHGASATHLLQALEDNGAGVLECVDNRAYGDIVIGNMIPDDLRYIMTFHPMPLEEWITYAIEQKYTYDFIFEDAMHDAEQVEFIWRHAGKLLNLGGMIVSHDALHAIAGEAVREGIARAGYVNADGMGNDVMNVLIAPADCGFAIWRKRCA